MNFSGFLIVFTKGLEAEELAFKSQESLSKLAVISRESGDSGKGRAKVTF